MAVREFDQDVLELMNLFTERTGTDPRDCITNERVYFLVPEGEAGAAIGKNGSNVKGLQRKLDRRIKIWEYSEDTEEFVGNMVPQAEEIDIEGDRVTVKVPQEEKGHVIGKEGHNINTVREFLRRNSEIEELEVK